MLQGTVKWFDPAKGFGFITSDEDDADVFVHHTAINADGYRELTEGQKVNFELEQTEKGKQASSVTAV